MGALTLIVLLISHVQVALCTRILMIPANHHSHVNFMSVAAQVLDRAGHNTTTLTVDRHQTTLQKKGVRALLHASTAKTALEDSEALQQFIQGKRSLLQMFHNMSAGSQEVCEEMLANDKLMRTIQENKFDLAIIDGFPMFRCMYVIPYKFSIPFITITAFLDTWQSRVPAMPSVEPYMGLVRFSNDMNIFQRFMNFAMHIGTGLMLPLVTSPNYLIAKHCQDKPQITFNELYLKSEMWLLNHDIISGDYPRTTAPHYQYIGGLGAEPSKPLSPDLEKFVQDAKGVVVVSFGSLVKTLPLEIVSKLLDAFRQRQEKFIMRFDTSTVDPDKLKIPDNVRLMKWIPQNDLLGHKKTVLFITHGGNNGMLETVYHGVPCLVMPIFGDQFYAGIKAKAKGYGDYLELFSFNTEQLTTMLTELIENRQFADTISRASEISQELYHPQESLVFWVNHILKYGGQHLKHKGFDMPLVQYLMLDVLVISVVLLGLILTCFVHIVGCCIRLCCCRKAKTKTE